MSALHEGMRDRAGLLRRTGRPAIRYGRWLVFGDGRSRRMGLGEYVLVRLGLQTTVRR